MNLDLKMERESILECPVVSEFGSRAAEISATHGAEAGRGHSEAMEEEDVRDGAGVAIWRRSDRYGGARL